jgi:thiamine transporter ThiT
MIQTTKLHSLDLAEGRAWLMATVFVAGNIIVPQACHLIPGAGEVLVPLYILTLNASLRYGLGVGLLTAVLSPVLNHLLFGMPPIEVLPSIVVKSVLLAVAAAWSVKLLLRR